MRRHMPTLYESSSQESVETESSSRHGTSSRAKRGRAKSFVPTSNGYTDIYSQFVKRYRPQSSAEDDPRNDPDSHYFERGLGQLIDAGDSDEEGGSSLIGVDSLDRSYSSLSEPESQLPVSVEQRERLEWQTMLASVLDGDVLKSEKTRIAVALESSVDESSIVHLNIWLELRAKLHGRELEGERKTLDEHRLHMVDAVITDINTFRADSETAEASPLKQVNSILHRLDVVHSLYPNLKAFHVDKPAAAEPVFQARCDALNTWSTILTSVRRHISMLRVFTNSETLDVEKPNTTAEVSIASGSSENGSSSDIADTTSFVERLLKEESMQRTFEKGFLTTMHSFIGTARDAQVNLSGIFQEMNLPTFENELIPLISFPTKLSRAALRVHLNYVDKLRDPEILIIDQMTEELKLSIGLACTLKRQYESFLAPDPAGKWILPQCINADYDETILKALSSFFRLIHWKLKSGVKGIYFKETDVLDAQWATFNDVSLTTVGGSSLVGEELCALTNKLMVRVTNYFETQVRVPAAPDNRTRTLAFPASTHTSGRQMTSEQMVSWYSKVLESVRLRYRKLQRFARVLTQRFSNSAEYSLEDEKLDQFITTLVDTDHILVFTKTFEEEGTYIVAPRVLQDRPDLIRRILTDAFHADDVTDPENGPSYLRDYMGDDYDDAQYLLIITPRTQFLWTGVVLMLPIPKIELDMKDNRVRLVADGPQHRLALAKQVFHEIFQPIDDQGDSVESDTGALQCVTDQQAHLPGVNRELRKIVRATNRLAESIVDSVHYVRNSLYTADGCQELLENWYQFSSEHGQHAQKYMDRSSMIKFNRLLIKLAISWVSFICDECDPTDRRTFKWAVNALEFTLHRTRHNILQLPDDQFEMLQQKVASCMTLLISHFDILGARSTIEARREKERNEEIKRQRAFDTSLEKDEYTLSSMDYDETIAFTDTSTRMYWEKVARSIHELEDQRKTESHTTLGRVLDNEKPEDRSLVFLASSSSNISLRWQQGRFIGAGAFGSVYVAVNLDSGSVMAVKEIKFQELSGMPNLYTQIRDELSVMEMLRHPNVVEYYGIEVHRDKVYIFEEYCQGGSLAALLEHGRIEDEGIIQVYTMQMLEGLAYLHSRGIVHRDIKPDNILLNHLGVIKFVDFGAAKILAQNQRTIQRSRRAPVEVSPQATGLAGFQAGLGMNMNNSLTGTPMYMSPEIIKNDKRGRHGAMDIWSLGCVVLEFATGKKPWSNLDNEWAIMFHIGVATQHPPLPEPGQLSELGISFIKQCLTIDPMTRPTAVELMEHPWMLEFREALSSYEEQEIATSPPADMPSEQSFEGASVAKQAAIMHEKELESMASPDASPS